MNSVRQLRARGFTIIEVMMFLGVSSLIAVVVIGGMSLAINQQRYQDALHSLQALIQQQYVETAHVVNGRSTADASTISCGSDGIVTDDATNGTRPGMSECFVMGRVVAISNDGSIRTANIVGIRDDDEVAMTDLEELQRYTYHISTLEQINTSVAWGSQVDIFRGGSDVAASDVQYLVILRSPLTGTARTFSMGKSSMEATLSAETDIVQSNIVDTKICVDRGPFGIGYGQGVLVRAGTGSASGVELLTASGGCSA